MASESQKLKQLKAALAKRATANWVNSLGQSTDTASDIVVTSSTLLPTNREVDGPALQQHDRVSGSCSSQGPELSKPQLSLSTTSYNQPSASVKASTMPQPAHAEPRGLSKLEQLKLALGSVSAVSTPRQPTSAKQCSLSKLEQLKAVLEESKRKSAASPQHLPPPLIPEPQSLMSTPPRLIPISPPLTSTPPPLIPVALKVAVSEEVAPDCANPVVSEAWHKRDSVGESVAQTMAAQPSEKAKVIKDVSAGTACSQVQLEHSVPGEDFSPARLPLGMRVPVVFLTLGNKRDVFFVQELFAQHDLVKMMKQLNVDVPKLCQRVKDSAPGAFVAVLREDDSTWYRGLICGPQKNAENNSAEKNDESGDKLRVLLIDYGRTANVPASSLLFLPPVFQRLPGFAIPVTLHGHPEIILPKEVSFEGEIFDAEVVDNSELCQSVRLYIRNDTMCLNDTLRLYMEPTS